MWRRTKRLLAVFGVMGLAHALWPWAASNAAERARCGPFAKVDSTNLKDACLGQVLSAKDGLTWPRSILSLSPNRLIVSDAAGWHARGKGRLVDLRIRADGKTEVGTLASGLSLPQGLALGPDGRVYFGEDTQISRIDPNAKGAAIEVLAKGLPGKRAYGGDHWHPLKQILFDKAGNLIVNRGAPGDVCEKPHTRVARYPCEIADGASPEASVWKLDMAWPEGTVGTFQTYRPRP